MIVSVEEFPDDTDGGLNDGVAPAGKPLTLRPIVCALPLMVCVPMLNVVEPPGVIDCESGPAEIEKSFPPTVTGLLVATDVKPLSGR